MVNFVPESCVSSAKMRSIYQKGAWKSQKQVSKMSIVNEHLFGKTGLHVPFLDVLLLASEKLMFFFIFLC